MATSNAMRKMDPQRGAVAADLEDLVGYNLKRAYIVMQSDFRSALGPNGLSARVFSALSLVTQFPNITQSALARKLGIERSGLVAIIDELEKRTYLERRLVPGDRRVQALVATKAGEAACRDALVAVRGHEAALLSNLTDDEKQTLVDLLKKIRSRGEDE